MVPKNQTFDNSKKNLLNVSRGMKEPTRIKKYRRGSAPANSGASLQPRRPNPEAGRAEKDNAKFLGQMNEFLFGKGMLYEQYGEAEKERGIATWEKATADQREGYEKAIKNGWINSKESPYFRESITNAYTDNLVHKASLKMWTDYEKWPDKNNPNSGSLEKFFQEQDDALAINLETIPDETLRNRFYEQWQAQKREITRKHGNYLNAEYDAKAQDTIDNKIYNLLVEYDEILDRDYRNNKAPLSQMLDGQRYTRDSIREIGRILETVGSDGRIPNNELEELRYKAVSKGGVYLEMYESLTGNTDAREVEPVPAIEGASITPEQAAKVVKIFKESKVVSTEAEVEVGNKEIVSHLDSIESNTLTRILYPSSTGLTDDYFEFYEVLAKKPTVQEKVISSMVLNDWLSFEDHDLTIKAKQLIDKGGGADGTLPVFLATSNEYPSDVQEFASSFAWGLEKQRTSTLKIWYSYLDEYYSGKKGSHANIWKKKKFVGDWENANFNLIHFKSYVQKLEEEGKI
jgi:hypothetical protein